MPGKRAEGAWAASRPGGIFMLVLWATLGGLAAARIFVSPDATGRWLAGVSALLATGMATVCAVQLWRSRRGAEHLSR